MADVKIKLCPTDRLLYNQIDEAGGCGIYLPESKGLSRLVEKDLIEVNSEMVDNDGCFAVRLKQVEAPAEVEETEAVHKEETAPMSEYAQAYLVESGIAMPKSRRGGGNGRSKYPFAAMGAPIADKEGNTLFASFHVAPSEKMKDPVTSLSSTCTAATKRFKDEDGNVVRKFLSRRVDATDPQGPGARVFRVR